jgi:hypothetical protein
MGLAVVRERDRCRDVRGGAVSCFGGIEIMEENKPSSGLKARRCWVCPADLMAGHGLECFGLI